MGSILFDQIHNGQDNVLLIFPPGAGKTTKAVQAILARATANEKTLYSGVTRGLCQQATLWANLKGDVMAEKMPRNSKNCIHTSRINSLSGKGWSAVDRVCRECPKFNKQNSVESDCGWWKQWDDPGHLAWAATHSHLASTLPFRHLKPKLLILDEGTVQACFGWAGGLEDGFTDFDLRNFAASLPATDPGFHTITFGDIMPGAAARLLIHFAERMQSWEKPESDMQKMMERVKSKSTGECVVGAEALGLLLGLDHGQVMDKQTLALLDALLKERDENRQVAKTLPSRDRHIIKELPEPLDLSGDSIPPNILAPLVEALVAARKVIEEQKSGTTAVAGAVPASLDLQRPEGDKPFFSIRIRTFNPIKVPADCRIVGIDATGNLDLFERCVGRKVRLQRVHIPFKGSVIQTTDIRLPKATLLNDKATTDRWVRNLKPYLIRLSEMHEKALVVTFKNLAHRLQNELKSYKGLTFKWFFGVRGEDYSGWKCQVTIGYPMSPPSSTYLDAAAIYQGEDLDSTWEKQWRPYLVAGEGVAEESLGLDVLVPKDPRLRAVHELNSDNEFYQVACSRNRILRNDVLSIVMSNIPFPPVFRVPVKLSTTSELLKTGERESSTSEKIHILADSLFKKLGWVSKSLLEVILVECEENPKEIKGTGLERYFPPGCLIINNIRHPGGYSLLPFLTQLSDGRLALRARIGFPAPLSPNRLREAWASYEPVLNGLTFEVSARLVGQIGQPRKDHVVGDLNLWLWDHAELLRDERLVTALDGNVVDASTIDRLRDLSEQGQRLVVDCDRLSPAGFLDDELDQEEYDAEHSNMLGLLQEKDDDYQENQEHTAGVLVRLRN